MTTKTGIVKLANYVERMRNNLIIVGARKRISLNTLRHISGLSDKSIAMHTSWNGWGKIRNGSLIFSRTFLQVLVESGI